MTQPAMKPVPPRLAAPIAFDRATPIALSPKDSLQIQGTLRTSHDGTTFLASDLFDFEGGGLRVVSSDPATGILTLAVSGKPSAQCLASGHSGACLLPKVREHAHKRLLTERDFVKSLSGGLTFETVVAPPPPPFYTTTTGQLALLGVGLLCVLLMAWLVRRVRTSSRRSTHMGQVELAASLARSEIGDDPALAPIRRGVDRLVAQAVLLDKARVAGEVRLRPVDLDALERRRSAYAGATSDEATLALKALDAERAEAFRLRDEVQASIAGLERIASTLRAVPLRVRAHRSQTARVSGGEDAVVAMTRELEWHEEATAEAEILTRRA